MFSVNVLNDSSFLGWARSSPCLEMLIRHGPKKVRTGWDICVFSYTSFVLFLFCFFYPIRSARNPLSNSTLMNDDDDPHIRCVFVSVWLHFFGGGGLFLRSSGCYKRIASSCSAIVFSSNRRRYM